MGNDVEYIREDNKIIFTKCPKILTKEIVDEIYFNENDGVDTVYLSEGIERIECSAFKYSFWLKEIHLAKGIKEIGKSVFSDCTDLRLITMCEGIEKIDDYAFLCCKELKNIQLPNSLLEIGEDAFGVCKKLEKVVIPPKVTEIKPWTFRSCKNLKEVVLHDKIKMIGNMSFYESGLTNINIPSSVQFIGENAFDRIRCIDKIYFPKAIQFINNPFSNSYTHSISKIVIDEEYEVDMKNTRFISNNLQKLFIYYSDREKYGLYDQNGYVEFDKSLFLKNVNLYKSMERVSQKGYIRLYYWSKKKFIPHYTVVLNMPFDEIDNFYVNNNCKAWETLVKKSDIKADVNKGTFFKLCYVLGIFNEKASIRDKAIKFIEENIIGKMNEEEIHARFDGFDLENGFNEEYSKFFMKYFDVYNFMKIIDIDGQEIDLMASSYNNFKKVKEVYPSKVVNTNRNVDILLPEHVIDAVRSVKYQGIDKGNEELAKLVGIYGYAQAYFDILQRLFNKGKSIKEESLKLFIKKDIKADISYDLLDKNNPLGIVLGDITNCCQVLSGAGEECLRYGVVAPNSKFMVFNYNNTIIGQSWVWYDEVSKTVCLDNIEVPTRFCGFIKKNKKMQKAFIECLCRVADGFKKEMNNRGLDIERVTIGEGYNDIKEVLNMYFELVDMPSKLSDYNGYSDAKNQYEISNSLR